MKLHISQKSWSGIEQNKCFLLEGGRNIRRRYYIDFTIRKNNCDRLFPSPAKHRPRIWLQPALLAVMSHIWNPVQSLGKMLLAAVRALDDDQCEQKPSSAEKLWGNPWNTLSNDHLPVNREHQWLPGGRTLPLAEFLPSLCSCSQRDGKETGVKWPGKNQFCLPFCSVWSHCLWDYSQQQFLSLLNTCTE